MKVKSLWKPWLLWAGPGVCPAVVGEVSLVSINPFLLWRHLWASKHFTAKTQAG